MPPAPANVDEYFDALSADRYAQMQVLRQRVRDALGDVEETFQYKMPTYERNGAFVCAIASQKHYLAVYTCTDVLKRFADDLAHLNCGKSCVRLKHVDDLKPAVLKKLLQAQLVEIGA